MLFKRRVLQININVYKYFLYNKNRFNENVIKSNLYDVSVTLLKIGEMIKNDTFEKNGTWPQILTYVFSFFFNLIDLCK